MTQAKYIEVGKIVKFLDCKSLSCNENGLLYETNHTKQSIPIILFEEDWNWLILLVQKIFVYKNNRYKLYMFHNEVIIFDSNLETKLIHVTGGNLNKMVYKACIQFINLQM